MATADPDGDRRAEIYHRRDTGYYSELPEAAVLSLGRPARMLSPIPSGRLSPSARRLLGRTSPEDIQREIEAVQHEIDVLSARPIHRHSRERGLESSIFDSGGRIVASDSPPCSSDRSGRASDLSDKRRASDRLRASVGPQSSGRPRSDRPAPDKRASESRPLAAAMCSEPVADDSGQPAADRPTAPDKAAAPDKPAQDSGTEKQAEAEKAVATTGKDSKRSLPTIKLGTFDGTTPLETFLAKFENCCEYYNWTGRDRVCHLKAVLDGQAGQVLWQISADATEDDIIRLLRNRFGNSNQMERFRAELHARRRRRGETVQSVYNDIRRLLALSFPGQSGELYEVIGRDCFLTALSDEKLRIRVMDQRPSTLDEALNIVCRMEAYSGGANDDDLTDDSSRRKVRVVNAKPSDGQFVEPIPETIRLKRLEDDLTDQRRQIRQLKSDAEQWRTRAEVAVAACHGAPPSWSRPPATQEVRQPYSQPLPPPNVAVQPQPTVNQSGWNPPVQQPAPMSVNYRGRGRVGRRGRGIQPRVDRDTCRNCYNRGHWAMDCPYRPYSRGGAAGDGQSDDQAFVNGVHGDYQQQSSETYIDAIFQGHVSVSLLVDTGSERSIVPKRIVATTDLAPRTTELFAANGNKLNVLGSTRLHFTVSGKPLYADVLVSDSVDECILGYDFLRRNHCKWLFDDGILIIDGLSVKLKHRPSRCNVRRIYVGESVVVPAEMQVNVPVVMPLANLHAPKGDWLVEPKEVRPGLLMARSLLSDSDNYRAVRLINLSHKDQRVDRGTLIGGAGPGLELGQYSEFAASRADTPQHHESCDVNPGFGCGASSGVTELAAGQPAQAELQKSDRRTSAPIRSSDKAMSGKGRGVNPGSVGVANSCHTPPQPLAGDSDWLECPTVTHLRSCDFVDRCDCSDSQNCKLFEHLCTAEPSVATCLSLSCALDGELSHMKPVIDSLPDELTGDQRKRAVDVLVRNADLFSKNEFDLGCTNLLTCTIETESNARPVAQPLRRHARAHLDAIDHTIDRMVEADLIEECSSPWAFNLVVVAKPGSPTTPRITVDLRGLNEVTVKDKFPLPRVQDCFDSLSGASWFCQLDLTGSFSQVPLEPQDRNKTAFISRRGQFRYKVMPQGFVNAPSVFSRLMSLAMRGLNWLVCLCFIDDVIVFAKTFDEALANLEAVLQRFRTANLKLKPSKCKMFQRRVKFLGHLVSESGIEADPERCACVTSWPLPRTVSELRSFLGLSNYYRAFCPGYAQIAGPLTEMLRRNEPIEWTERRLRAFDELKDFLVKPPTLAIIQDEGDLVLDVDASLTSCGAVLQQRQNSVMRVIEFASRTFNRAERNYCVTRREMTALVFALRRFKHYLLNRKFTCRVDHMAIVYYKRVAEPTGQHARHLDFISMFDMDVVHRSGSRHGNCDSLSRIRPCERDNGEPCKQCNRRVTGRHVCVVQTRAQRRKQQASEATKQQIEQDAVISPATERPASRPDAVIGPEGSGYASASPAADRRGKLPYPTIGQGEPTDKPQQAGYKQSRTTGPGLLARTSPRATAMGVSTWDNKFIAEQQFSDADIKPVISWINNESRPSWEEAKACSPTTRALWHQYESLVMIDGVLHRIFHNHNGDAKHYQVVMPVSLRTAFLELIHCDVAGHLKFVKCIEHVQSRAWWITWRRDLKSFIDCCDRCAAYHRGAPPRQSKLRPMVIGSPGFRWVIDLTGPFCVSQNCKYIFTAVCPFSKFAIATPIKNKEAKTVAKALVNHVFLKHGLCVEILSDLGPEFQAELSVELYRVLGIKQLRSSGYRPQTSGVVEIWHRTLNTMLAKIVSDHQRDWSLYVDYVVFCYNATPHSATGYAPYFVMTGRQPRWNVDLIFDQVRDEDRDLPNFVADTIESLEYAHRLARENLQRAADKAAEWYDKRVRSQIFNVGDAVRVYCPRRYVGRTVKWQKFYGTTGTVERRLNDATYVVLLNKGNRSERKIFHADKLKLCLACE